jgi:hypothetical protein
VFNRIDLRRYTCIVMVGGSYAGIDSSGRESLKRWIEIGGTVIAMEQATEWIVNSKIASARFRKDERKDTVVTRRAYTSEEDYARALEIPGTIFQARYDRTHPIFYGYEDSLLSVFRGTSIFLDPSKNPYATPLQYTERPLLSGYVHRQHEKHIKGSAGVVVSGVRNGRVILMVDNPNFRAFWYGTNRMFLNSIFFGGTIRGATARGEE